MNKLLLITLVFSAPAIGMNEEGMRQFLDTVTALRNYFWPVNSRLLEAVRIWDEKAVERALDDGANPNWQDPQHFGGETPLFITLLFGNNGKMLRAQREIIKLLIQRGANPNLPSATYGYTPLQREIRYGNTALVATLIENGADITTEDHENNTPLDSARNRYGEGSEIYKLLLDERRKQFQSRVKGIAI